MKSLKSGTLYYLDELSIDAAPTGLIRLDNLSLYPEYDLSLKSRYSAVMFNGIDSVSNSADDEETKAFRFIDALYESYEYERALTEEMRFIFYYHSSIHLPQVYDFMMRTLIHLKDYEKLKSAVK